MKRTPDVDFVVVLAMIAVLAVAAAIALRTITVSSPIPDIERMPGIGQFGYTFSLALFFLPSAAIAGWFFTRSRYVIERRSFVPTVLLGFASGCILDVVFGNTFLVFRNAGATLGIFLPGWVPHQGWRWNIPIEEFIFYGLGFTTILLIYVWGNLYWFGAYCADDLAERARDIPRIVQPHWPATITVVALLGIGYAYRFLGPARGTPGFPGYFTFLILTGALPALLFLKVAKPFINWRALSFTVFVLLFISLLWEVTLGVPYSWWGYRDEAMLGLFIEAWAHLPIEAVLVWIAACYGTVITYETIRLLRYSEKPVREGLFGTRPQAPAMSVPDR